MKQFKFIGLFFCLSTTLFSQSLTGTVQSSTGEGLEYANVLLLKASDSSLHKGAFTNENGLFNLLEIEAGSYLLHCRTVGYLPYFSSIFELNEENDEMDFGLISLNENSSTLEEVQIVAERPLFEQKIDRTVVNVSNSVTNAGSTALDVLSRSPGVQVNRSTRSISLSGKEGIMVMMNGKLTRMPMDAVVQLLEGMSSESIDKIELIHTPPSEFDAEGDAGVINIVMKQSGDKGLNGSYSLNAGYGKKEKYGGNVNFNFRKNKVNVYGDYAYNLNHNPQVFTNYRSVLDNGIALETDARSNRDSYLATQNARLGVDFDLGKKTVLGVLGTYLNRDWEMDAENLVDIREDNVRVNQYVIPNTEVNIWESYLGNVNLFHRMREGESISFDVDYSTYQLNNPSNYLNRKLDSNGTLLEESEVRIRKKTPIEIMVGKADYKRTFLEKINFETGLKATNSTFENDVRVEDLEGSDWIARPSFTGIYNFSEKVLAGYAAVAFPLGENIDVKAGLRYEHTNANLGSVTEPNIVDRNYGNFFPSVYLTRKLTETSKLSFSYSRRINRPAFTQLAPYLVFYDPSTQLGGNTSLQPSISDGLRLSYNYKTWNFGLSYGYSADPIRYVPSIDTENNVQISRPENLKSAQNYAANVSFPIKFAKYWEMRTNLNGMYLTTDFSYDDVPLTVGNFAWSLTNVHNIGLGKGFSFEASLDYNAPSYWGIALWESTNSLNFGLQKSFENGSSLQFNVRDVFLGNNWFGSTSEPEVNLDWKGSFQMTERTFMITYRNSFGNKKLKAARSRETGSADVRRRVN